MTKYRKQLPQLGERIFATDAGLETELVFHDGRDLPCFAAFTLLASDEGSARLRRYYQRFADLSREHGFGLVLEAPTWRASPDWGEKLGYSLPALAEANRKAIDLMLEIRAEAETPATPIAISGNLGPRGDGYRPDARMSADQSREYHDFQVRTFAETEADMVAAFTMNYVEEAIGIAAAAKANGMPVAISFTLETDGRLPTGQSLAEAIESTDAATGTYPAYYMINCAHPTHFEAVLREGGAWRERLRGIRANASKRSHAELDESTDIDDGNPEELGGQYRALRPLLPKLAVVGGCCGTDQRHVASICRALAESPGRRVS